MFSNIGLTRISSAIVLGLLFLTPASAQTVRFDTNVGTFDLELNPTGNPNLQGHVDNMIAYVEAKRYDLTVINRADEGFVMQMGGFQLNGLDLPNSFDFPDVPSFDNVIVDADGNESVDFDLTGLDNLRGTVSLALDGRLNSGTSSFFVNVSDNSGSLNSQGFIPFATISDMTTIDLIMGLPQANLPNRPNIPQDLAGDDVPLLENDRLVFIERAFMLETEEEAAAAMMSSLLDGGTPPLSELLSTDSPSASQSLTVPEPPALVLAVGALMMIYIMKPSKNR